MGIIKVNVHFSAIKIFKTQPNGESLVQVFVPIENIILDKTVFVTPLGDTNNVEEITHFTLKR